MGWKPFPFKLYMVNWNADMHKRNRNHWFISDCFWVFYYLIIIIHGVTVSLLLQYWLVIWLPVFSQIVFIYISWDFDEEKQLFKVLVILNRQNISSIWGLSLEDNAVVSYFLKVNNEVIRTTSIDIGLKQTF